MSKIYVDAVEPEGITTDLTLGDAGGTDKVVIPGTVKIAGGSPGLNKVLKSDATGEASWGTDVGGSMALVEAEELTSDVTEWQCLNKMSSTYRNYLLLFNAIAPDSSSSSGNHIYIRFGDATISSDLNHKWAFRYINSNSNEAYEVSNGDTNGFRLGRHVQSEPNADSESSGISGAIWIYNPASASYNTSVNYLCTYWGLDEAHGSDRFVYLHGGGALGNQSADLSFEFHSYTGGLEGTDITSYFRLYGLKDS